MANHQRVSAAKSAKRGNGKKTRHEFLCANSHKAGCRQTRGTRLNWRQTQSAFSRFAPRGAKELSGTPRRSLLNCPRALHPVGGVANTRIQITRESFDFAAPALASVSRAAPASSRRAAHSSRRASLFDRDCHRDVREPRFTVRAAPACFGAGAKARAAPKAVSSDVIRCANFPFWRHLARSEPRIAPDAFRKVPEPTFFQPSFFSPPDRD